ncbi:autophagy protein 12 [Lobosporangium transversale]|uniref:Ubiquitin-like protein ATG12 n=1 Tax=Lobosporangium transversale TaxID=64571 RepID=A0A1Y2GR00_9FUNG|nr:autophagy protein 12 [Lobosporangium transversale]ORZ19946.1 autophagy protein 12 [Lobosporangium transversale]|eukprot:XP_021882486.1 autophagy protein 12 [Lobosporangium transversale]
MSNSGTPSSETPPIDLLAQDTINIASTEPTGPPASPATVIANRKKKDISKVVVRFRAIGNAPILKTNVYKITASNKFLAVIQFLRKELNYKQSDPLFLYVNSAFSPAPDEIVNNLFKCFNTDGKLIVNYCTSPAWG